MVWWVIAVACAAIWMFAFYREDRHEREPLWMVALALGWGALALWPALITGATQPAVELLLDRPLDDQPGAEPGELGQHPLRVIDHPLPKQLVDARLYLR